MKKTYMQKTAEIKRDWHLVDLDGKTLGRAATDIAKLLIGKHRASYTTHIDSGDFVVVINAANIVLSGTKMLNKTYSRHSGRPDGFKSTTAGELMAKDPKVVIEHAVKGMIPKNKLQTPRMRRLKVYAGAEHPHTNHFTKKEE